MNRYRLLFSIILLLLFSPCLRAGEWQWSVTLDGFVSNETNRNPTAFLWIPADCMQIKAIIVGQHNISEETLFDNPLFREKMQKLGIGFVWITPGIDQQWDVSKGTQQIFEKMMVSLADVSGYSELKNVPIVPIGHSAMATYPWNFAAWNPERTLAIISLHGDAPRTNLTGYGRENLEWGRTRNIDGIPGLMIEGEYEWWEYRSSVISGLTRDSLYNILGVCQSIQRYKTAEQEMREARDKALQADKLKSAFLANMSHEIRTPLNSIVGFSSLLAETDDREERQEYIKIVETNNELLLQLVSDILDLSKIESGTFDFVRSDLDVNESCMKIIKSMEMKVPETVDLVFEKYMPDCHIYTDKNRFMQVITNFINNALKFTKQGTIALGYEQTAPHEIKFYVRDTGFGIPKEKIDSIFERFVKLNTFVQGTGLGLSICKSLVSQMGGKIGVESTEGEGSCFWFTHPY